ncbi:hypothetical protein [Enterobacter sp. MGH 3]|uniref:hypothetical protein n=1 Tax=Enterobacter sp. MGH 3 TaxID=1329812 RepID=UPI000515874C|nr:hypothetical protein [Enterobacter sp. MGH 3]
MFFVLFAVVCGCALWFVVFFGDAVWLWLRVVGGVWPAVLARVASGLVAGVFALLCVGCFGWLFCCLALVVSVGLGFVWLGGWLLSLFWGLRAWVFWWCGWLLLFGSGLLLAPCVWGELFGLLGGCMVAFAAFCGVLGFFLFVGRAVVGFVGWRGICGFVALAGLAGFFGEGFSGAFLAGLVAVGRLFVRLARVVFLCVVRCCFRYVVMSLWCGVVLVG